MTIAPRHRSHALSSCLLLAALSGGAACAPSSAQAGPTSAAAAAPASTPTGSLAATPGPPGVATPAARPTDAALPGSQWAYSNYGFVLLGAVIEKVTGQSYYDYVAQRVYAPAGMKNTGSFPEDQNVPLRSVGYMRFRAPGTPANPGAKWFPNSATLPYRGTSAGGGYSTVADLLASSSRRRRARRTICRPGLGCAFEPRAAAAGAST